MTNEMLGCIIILAAVGDMLLLMVLCSMPSGSISKVLPKEPDVPTPVSDHLTEFARQEKYIDEWVAEHRERAASPEDEQHQRWEGLQYYNRTKR